MKDDPLIKVLEEYYIPQLKFNMTQNREFAYRNKKYKDIASGAHGAANAFEVSIGCVEEAIQRYRDGDLE